MNFDLDYDPQAPDRRIRLSGELTIYTVAEIKARVSTVLEETPTIEFDLAGVSEIDTAGLQLMLLIKKKQGANVQFVRHSEAVLQLIDLANLAGTLGDPVVISAKSTQEQTQ